MNKELADNLLVDIVNLELEILELENSDLDRDRRKAFNRKLKLKKLKDLHLRALYGENISAEQEEKILEQDKKFYKAGEAFKVEAADPGFSRYEDGYIGEWMRPPMPEEFGDPNVVIKHPADRDGVWTVLGGYEPNVAPGKLVFERHVLPEEAVNRWKERKLAEGAQKKRATEEGQERIEGAGEHLKYVHRKRA